MGTWFPPEHFKFQQMRTSKQINRKCSKACALDFCSTFCSCAWPRREAYSLDSRNLNFPKRKQDPSSLPVSPARSQLWDSVSVCSSPLSHFLMRNRKNRNPAMGWSSWVYRMTHVPAFLSLSTVVPVETRSPPRDSALPCIPRPTPSGLHQPWESLGWEELGQLLGQ